MSELSLYAEDETLSVENVSASNIILMFRNEICCCSRLAIQNQNLSDSDTDHLKEIYNTLSELFQNAD